MGTNLTNSLNSGAPLLSSTGQIFLSMPILISGTHRSPDERSRHELPVL